MSALSRAHLGPLAAAWIKALKDGTISIKEADDFVDTIHAALLQHRVDTNPHLKKEAVYAPSGTS